MVRKLYIKEDAYPMDWKPSKDDIDRVFSALDQSKSKNPDFLNDNFGFSRYDVKFGDSRKTYISIYVAIDKDGYIVDETFYISPDEKRDTYKISTEELGERTVGKSTDVWDIISTCLRKQLRNGMRESLSNLSKHSTNTESELKKSTIIKDEDIHKIKESRRISRNKQFNMKEVIIDKSWIMKNKRFEDTDFSHFKVNEYDDNKYNSLDYFMQQLEKLDFVDKYRQYPVTADLEYRIISISLNTNYSREEVDEIIDQIIDIGKRYSMDCYNFILNEYYGDELIYFTVDFM